MVSEMGVFCERRKLKVHVNKSKVMKVSKSGEYKALNGAVEWIEIGGDGLS